ncbi:prephenate dehydratase [Basilea psittacipulmonis]|uniref:Bifunctional chorismate mutase/prephenate dehydratase n=1 Tax=Basilea psittacipulmonis DSM 24701 TaxID=1072685 RepID=A0A077DHD0_9BURK|nr:prephenate dehydratase [Basilea psittacipulmonis]AIL32917.1 chorismate mutase [Basilea psittacipulmonis DSM 24701]
MDKLQEALLPLRAKIDEIDSKILELLNERAQAAIDVGEAKRQYGVPDGPILRPEREAQIIRSLQTQNQSKIFPKKAIEAVWMEIISACRGLERGLTVAFLGPEGSFSEEAALLQYGHAVNKLACPSFDEVFRAVETGRADVGMVAVENSTEGAVNRTQDLLLQTPLCIHAERILPIRHNLMTQSGNMEGIQEIHAHPQALAQCQLWLRQFYPLIPCVPATSNSAAAKLASESKQIAAIAAEHAADYWGLDIVARDIQDDPQNRTRFVAIGRIKSLPSGKDRTSFIVAVPNRSGALYHLITPLNQYGVSMTRFESRPAKNGQWDYYFYIDVEGHYDDENVRLALDDIKANSAFFRMLGSYPIDHV